MSMKVIHAGSRHRTSLWVFLTLIMLSFSGCEEDPGCLDIQANNYQVDAEDPCDDCCSYPELRLSFQHNWVLDDSVRNFDTGRDVYTIGGVEYQFNRIRYYLSGIHLVREDGTFLELNERLEFELPDGVTESVEDNFVLLEAGSFQTLVPGRYRRSGTFTELRFIVGVSMPAGAATPEQFPENHPLAAQSPPMYAADSGYLHSLITFSPVREDSTSYTWETFGTDRLREVSLPLSFTLDPGFHTEIRLAINYRAWFTGINLTERPSEVVLDQIVSNQANSFSLASINSTLN